MFINNRYKEINKLHHGHVNKRILAVCLCITLCLGVRFLDPGITAVFKAVLDERDTIGSPEASLDNAKTEELIRFHVIANSDSNADQQLKYAVRDAILKKVAPRLAESDSLSESRNLILGMEDELLQISQQVVRDWGKTDTVTFDYGVFPFPTKSYGNIVLPGGDYEAVEIKIGKAEGANWWCVLYPPLCFVNVEESTTVSVDGKAGVPLDSTSKNKKPAKKVGFLLQRLFR